MKTCKIRCGKEELTCRFPGNWQVSELHHEEPEPKDFLATLAGSLEKPFGEKPFAEWLSYKKILIVVPDITRYCGAEKLLPPLYNWYLQGKETQILFALGNHRKQTIEEQKGLVSEYIFERIPCFDHDCYNKERLVTVGKTSSGLDVVINAALVEAEAIIIVGSISFHYLAGFGGGRKAIFPGVAGYDSIIGIHRKVFNRDKPGKHPLARSGSLEGNPMHEEIMEAISCVKTPVFLVNTVIDDKKNLLNIFSGNIRDAHLEGCKWFMEHFSCKVTERGDIVVVSGGGSPKDINFIQAHKAIEHGLRAVKPGGTMIVAGKCEDGLGNADFLKWFAYGSSDQMEPYVRESDKVYAQTAYATRFKAEYCNIVLVSDLDDDDVKKMGLIPMKNIQDAIDRINEDNSSKLCYVIPDGANTLAVEPVK